MLQFPFYQPATLVDGQYQYMGPGTKSMGPHHPQDKSAIVSVTRRAKLRLLYQQLDSKWLEVITDLEGLATSDDVISHASFCADKGASLIKPSSSLRH